MLPRLADFERVERKRQSENGHVVDMSGAMMQAYREPVEAALSTMSDRSVVDRHARILEVINGAPATAGNDSRILLDGPQTWQAIFTAMATARDHIHIESFIFEDLVFGSRLSDLLVAKAKDG